MEQKPKLLILSPRFPFPLEKGDKLRLYYQIKYLSRNFHIHLISLNEEEITKESIKEIEQYTAEICVIEQSNHRNVYAGIQAFFRRKALQTSYYYEKRIQSRINVLIQKIQPDLIFVQLVRMGAYVTSIKIPKVIDYMDAMSLNMKREAENHTFPKRWIYNRESKLLAKAENKMAAFFDIKTIISEPDKEYLLGEGVKELKVQGNGVDFEFFKPRNKKTEYDIAFVGNMGYLPNVEAAEYLVNEVIPRLDRTVNVLIAGARPHKRVLQLENNNVKITGWLEDIRDAYDSADIMVAPIFSGAGQQNKILEAMSMGKPCITTEQVNNAIGAKENEEIVIANNAEEFEKALEFLLNNPEKRTEIAKNARIFVERNFSWKKQVDILDRALQSLLIKE